MSNNFFTGKSKFLLCLLLVMLTVGLNEGHLYAQSAKPCPPWLKTIVETGYKPLNITTPAVAPIRRVAEAIENMMRKNAAFNDIPELRRRSSYGLLVDSLYGVHVRFKGYDKEVWEGCGVIRQVDRLDAAIGIYFYVNSPAHFIVNKFDHVLGFLEKLEAFAEPVFVEMISGNIPLYRSGVTKQPFVLLTYNDKVPWVPLALAEYLTAFEGSLNVQKADYEEEKRRFAEDTANFNPWKNTKEWYEHLKKTNPKAAAEHKALMEKLIADKPKANGERVRLFNKRDSTLNKLMLDLKNYRAALTTMQLQGPAFAGHNKFLLWDETQNKNWKTPLVKMGPEYRSKKDRTAVRIITIFAGARTKWKEYAPKVRNTLDYKLLKSLMR